MLTFDEMLTLHLQALDATSALTAGVGSLTVPTPCEGWDLADLFGHMIGQNTGFAAAVADGDAPVAAYASVPVRVGDLTSRWTASATRIREAFAGADPAATVHLAELGFSPTIEIALGMQLLDTAVHAWDVATALGTDYRPAAATVSYVLDMARQIAARPDGTPVFDAPLETIGDDPWSDALRLLGRRAR